MVLYKLPAVIFYFLADSHRNSLQENTEAASALDSVLICSMNGWAQCPETATDIGFFNSIGKTFVVAER